MSNAEAAVEGGIGPEAVRLLDGPTWHLTDTLDSLTLSGRVNGDGPRRRSWTETPEDDRCHLCFLPTASHYHRAGRVLRRRDG